MAFSNIQKDMDSFFKEIAKGVREDMENSFIHILTINFNDSATGFDKAARQISGVKDYIAGDPKSSWKSVIKKICENWNKGSTGLNPGQVFRTVKTGSPSTGFKTLKGIPIENCTVNSFNSRECVIQILVPNKVGDVKINTFMTNFRRLVWDKWNKNNSQSLKFGKEVGQNTNFGHSQQSTVGLKQMEKLSDARQNEPDNPFENARGFIGQSGIKTSISLDEYVKDQLLGAGASVTFSQKLVNGKLEQVVEGRIDPSNKAGSEVTDKKAFNKYIKKYYKEQFLDKFNNKTTKDKKKIAKSMGFETIGEFRSSESYNSTSKKHVGNMIATELSKGKTLKQIKAPKKSKNRNRKKTFRPKNKPKSAVGAKKAIRTTTAIKKGRQGASTQHNPIALKELINAALPAELAQRMHPPALRNRTGRFRQSAEVTNVLVGPRGGVEAEYTYMRNPYETFEPGGAQGSTSRDPRRLIGGSVREIAMRLTGNKFIRTRRV